MGIYTDKAESALKKAQRFSARMHHPYTGTEHILMGLLDEPDSTAGQVLAGAGVTPKGLAEMIDQLIAPEGMVLTEERRGYTPRARKILDDAVVEARRFHEEETGTEHILIAMLKDGECVASRLLTTMNVRLRDLYKMLVSAMGEKASEYKEEIQQSRRNSDTGTVQPGSDSSCRGRKDGSGGRPRGRNSSGDSGFKPQNEE